MFVDEDPQHRLDFVSPEPPQRPHPRVAVQQDEAVVVS